MEAQDQDSRRLLQGDRAGRRTRRLVFTRNEGLKEQLPWFDWALRRDISAVVLPFPTRFLGSARLEEEAGKRGFAIERGGWDFCLFTGRGIFMPRDMLRMQDGRRRNDHNFCPTNPELIVRIRKNAARLFGLYKETKTFHLWPDQGHEKSWCSCPACRAFSWEEQNRMAVNAVAEVLAVTLPGAELFYYDPLSGRRPGIKVLPNMRGIQKLPGSEGAEEAGWFLARARAPNFSGRGAQG